MMNWDAARETLGGRGLAQLVCQQSGCRAGEKSARPSTAFAAKKMPYFLLARRGRSAICCFQSLNPKTTILIADDHPIFRKGLREVVETDPNLRLVCEVGDGEQALREIESLRPDVAILDIHMPRRSGMDVARAVWTKGLAVRLIVLTMYDDEVLFNEAMGLGVLGYVLKENAVEDLLNAIRAAHAGRTFISPSVADYLLNRHRQKEDLNRSNPGLQSLTPAERRILKLIAEDRTTKEIADDLKISPRTVETHRQNISTKLDLSGSHSLLKFAYDNKALL